MAPPVPYLCKHVSGLIHELPQTRRHAVFTRRGHGEGEAVKEGGIHFNNAPDLFLPLLDHVKGAEGDLELLPRLEPAAALGA